MDLSLLIAVIVAALGIPTAILATLQIIQMRASRNSMQIETTPQVLAIAPTPAEAIGQWGFLTIDTRPLLGMLQGIEWQVPYEKFTHVIFLLKEIEASIGDAGYYTTNYGETWLVHDACSNKIVAEVDGKILPLDSRTLQEAGIKPGMKLEAFPFVRPIERESEFVGFAPGTYSHGLGMVPDQVFIVANDGLAEYSVDSITSTSVHVNINSLVGFRGHAIKYAPITPQVRE